MNDFTKKRITKIMDNYTQNAIPPHFQNQMILSSNIRGNNVALIEERPAFMSDRWVQHPMAQFRVVEYQWRIYWKDSKNKGIFTDDILPDADFEKQLSTVVNDNRGLFRG
ncbi:DUF3024 domain-containing protein [Paenibacillus sp. 481]|uniref:DUF3024 domain-containing protein n=1 Tax=Paenibacillus sp. 481 TaxID=2835869 RepID=UPI001E5AD075|nr:DUF3024 domain-containing protein [Paenibacillus sp. 481]UHA71917.1 DUF3024 domain-containing protein [Paenibacillus sp. 481]